MRTARNQIARALLENHPHPEEVTAMRLVLEDATLVVDTIRNCYELGQIDLVDLLGLEVAA